jgi:hypothetical protein
MKGQYMHRNIDGKQYVIWFPHEKKSTAQAEAKKLRNEGYNVRVLPLKKGQPNRNDKWATYRSSKKNPIKSRD